MSESGIPTWSRSRYPLQAEHPSNEHRLLPNEIVQDQQTWSALGSSTAVSPSQNASSPTEGMHLYPLPLGHSSEPAVLTGVHREDHAPTEAAPSIPGTCPLQAEPDDSQHAMAKSSNNSHILTNGQSSKVDPIVDTQRILRRSPRSRSLRTSTPDQPTQTSSWQNSSGPWTVSLPQRDDTSPATSLTGDKSAHPSPADHWQRQIYPLQSMKSGGHSQELSDLTSIRERRLADSVPRQNMRETQDLSHGHIAFNGLMCPMRNSNDDKLPSSVFAGDANHGPYNGASLSILTASSNHRMDEQESSLRDHEHLPQMPSVATELQITSSPAMSEIFLANPRELSSPHATNPDHGSNEPVSMHPGRYPLQEGFGNAILRSLTPPSSQDTVSEAQTKDSVQQLRGHDRISSKSGGSSRRAYPLQSPVSMSSLKETPVADGPGSSSDSVRIPNDLPHHRNSSGTRTSRRQAYPLQGPANALDMRNAAVAESSRASLTSLSASDKSISDSNQEEKDPKLANSFRRQLYPLQSPSWRPSSEDKSATRYARPKESAFQPAEEQPPTSSTKTIHRHVYPLQSPASIPALRLPPSPSPSPPPSPKVQPESENLLSVEASRKDKLTSKVIKHWRRQVYPLQSPENTSSFSRAPTPQPLEPEPEPKTTEPIHLPKHIRAVQEAGLKESGRTIIVCLDGTGDKFDDDNSNIVHLISALKKDDANQVSYYQAGIGTYSRTGLSTGFVAALDMAVGSELGLHVRDAYQFLMHSYKEGDRICIFGFSRGAYTARCLAGMVHKVGLLPPRNLQQIAFAYEFYTNDTDDGWRQSRDFKATFCIDVSVHFLGCFDSVASVGFIPRQLPLSSTPTNKARYFRHAMALDERRAKFKVCRHQTKDATGWETTAEDQLAEQNDQRELYRAAQERFGQSFHPNVTDEEYERLVETQAAFDTDVLEVWFAGCHCDVGGGAVANTERHKLAQIPLRWMIRQTFECNTGIIFKVKKLAEFGLDVHTLWPKYTRLNAPSHGPPPSFLEKYEHGLPPRSIRRSKLVPIDKVENGERLYHLMSPADEDWTPEQVEDFFDVMSPLNDELAISPRWWLLEFYPVQYKVPIRPGEVELRTGMNLGRYRGVDDFEPNLHWTVLHRAQYMGYKIQARTAAHTKWRIVV